MRNKKLYLILVIFILKILFVFSQSTNKIVIDSVSNRFYDENGEALTIDENGDTIYATSKKYYNEEVAEDAIPELYSYQPISRNFSSKFQTKYKKDPEFDYTEKIFSQKPMPNISLNFLSVIGKMLMYIAIIALLLIVIYILYQILKNRNSTITKKNRKVRIENEEVIENEEDIAQNRFDILITQYENEAHYRMAFRYQYLWIIQQLSHKKLILWQKKKTNSDYFLELKTSKHQQEFKDISRIFDYVWYGEFALSPEQYNKLKQQLNTFRNSL